MDVCGTFFPFHSLGFSRNYDVSDFWRSSLVTMYYFTISIISFIVVFINYLSLKTQREVFFIKLHSDYFDCKKPNHFVSSWVKSRGRIFILQNSGEECAIVKNGVLFDRVNLRQDHELESLACRLFCCNSPTRAKADSFLRFLDRTQDHTIGGGTPVDEWSARREDLYLKTQHWQERDLHASSGIRTRNTSKRSAAAPRLRPLGHRNRLTYRM